MRNEGALVTVVIPTYNRARVVIDALDSVFAQTYGPVEVLVVDDGSTDDTVERVSDWIETHRRDMLSARLLRQSRGGAPSARNHGLDQAAGAYVKFFDSDDLMMPRCLEVQVRALAETAENVSIYSDAILDSGRRRWRGYVGKADERDPIAWVLANFVSTALPLHRTRNVRKVKGFDESVTRSQDKDLNLRLTLEGCRYVYLNRAVCEMRSWSTDRISARKVTADGVWEPLRRIDGWRDLILRRGGSYTPSVRKALARLYRHAAARVAREGFAVEAKVYLGRSVDLVGKQVLPYSVTDYVHWNVTRRLLSPNRLAARAQAVLGRNLESS